MRLSAGTKLGPYEIVAQIGAGGMGEVYRARDSRLGRDIAIKVSSEQFSERFEREARSIAALNHPNICHLYDVGPNYLVMELIEGEALKGSVPLVTAIEYARQIADALEAAHERGIIHRDLKPANILITADGVVKVLDFGLAKNTDAPPGDPESSPTMTISPTRAGMILGTAAYMAPEQARGKAVDRRADIWAFGVVFYEMLSGHQPFSGGGETITDVLAAVITKTPDWTLLPSDTPPSLRHLIERCLDKDVKRRLRDIGEARIALEQPMPSEAETKPAQVRNSRWPWIVSAATLLASIILAVMYWRATQLAPSRAMRFNVDLGPDLTLSSPLGGAAVLSPDGDRLVYAGETAGGTTRLFTRTLDQTQAAAMPDTEGAAGPFFSPDGQWVGFFAHATLRKIRVGGGSAVTLCDAPSQRGGSWSEDGSIIAALNSTGGLSRVPQDGGAAQTFAKLSIENRDHTHRWPQVLNGSDAVLFTAHEDSLNFDEASIVVQSLKDGTRKTLHRGGYYGRYVPANPSAPRKGFLVYIQRGTLFAAPMDAGRLELTGPPVAIAEGVMGNPDTGGAQFDISRSGMLVFQAGKPASQKWVLDLLDSTGKSRPLLTVPGSYTSPRFSPDGSLIALNILEGHGNDIWLYEWQRDRLSRLTFQGNGVFSAVWFPNGKYIAFSSAKHGGAANVYWMRADGSGDMVRLMDSPSQQVPWSFSADGKRLAYIDFKPDTALDIWTVPLDLSDPDHPKPGRPEPFLNSPAVETYPSFSPDGRWLAYMSNESGVSTIYARSFPGPGGKWQIASGGVTPVWSQNGRELFYRTTEDRRIMVVSYTVKGDAFIPEKPRLWSDKQVADTAVLSGFDVAPDGKHAAVLSSAKDAAQAPLNHLTFIVNFSEELQSKLAAGAKVP
jgi:Tol biopolymer transport system component